MQNTKLNVHEDFGKLVIHVVDTFAIVYIVPPRLQDVKVDVHCAAMVMLELTYCVTCEP